jgi:uncharacterized protein YkwD
VVPVLIAAGVYLLGGPGGADAPNQAAPGQGHTTAAGLSPARTRPGSVTDVQGAAACAPVSSMSAPCSVGGARVVKMSARTSGGPANPGSAGRPAGPASPAPGSARGSTPRSSSASSPAAASPVAAAAQGTPADQVLALIDQARSQAGLPALTFSAALDQSASAHNLTMANACGLSHQCPGEPPIGTRETDAGVHWTSAGENIGEAGPEANTTAAVAAAAVGLTQDMLNEKPPDDGHRLNILSSSFAHIGIAVYRSSSGTVWLTQDFSN